MPITIRLGEEHDLPVLHRLYQHGVSFRYVLTG
jgi:hypothetical protein